MLYIWYSNTVSPCLPVAYKLSLFLSHCGYTIETAGLSRFLNIYLSIYNCLYKFNILNYCLSVNWKYINLTIISIAYVFMYYLSNCDSYK